MIFRDADALPNPPLTDLLRVHDYEYLQHLEHKAAQAIDPINSAKIITMPEFYARAGLLDFDTPLVANSLTAAKKFCR